MSRSSVSSNRLTRACPTRNYTGPVKIGNPGEFSMLEFAEIVLRLVCGKTKLTSPSLPADEPKQRQPDFTMAKSRLDWEPKVN